MTASMHGHAAARWTRAALRTVVALAIGWTAATASAQAPSKQLAPGFAALPRDAKVVMMPIDVELFSLSAGGVPEPKADWTASAHKHMAAELAARTAKAGLKASRLDDAAADEYAEQFGLHAAVARSIELHHAGVGWALPTKEGRLDWTFGDAMQPLAQATGAQYGLFVFVRDSYASAERKAAMVAIALLSLGNAVLSGGVQVGYASLVDLDTGRVVWFNRLVSGTGDLREAVPAAASIEKLLAGFPAVQ